MRLIRSGPGDPAGNLALDEALLRSGRETLRLYAWDPPGYSLGFFQRAADHPAPPGFVRVRRPTGGGAIAHESELTVAWIGRRRPVDRVYAQVNAIVRTALAAFGIETGAGRAQPEAAPAGLCFDAHTCYDLLADGRKIFGSAQRRGGDRFLVHGSLPLAPNRLARGAISMEELLGRPVPRDEAEQAVIRAAEMELGTAMLSEQPTAEERARAGALVRERYGNERWTRRR